MLKTEVIKINPRKPETAMIKKAAGIIKKGGLVAFPTETVYGLGADYLDKDAVRKLYKVKNRPAGKPFTAHIADIKALKKLSCEISGPAKKLIKIFWPGPLTLIVSAGNGEKIGVRMPANKAALDFISACETPIAAPSANISGNKPPVTADEVLSELGGKIEAVLDGGRTEIGIESTIVDLTTAPYKMLRIGAISEKEIARVLTD